MHCRNTVISALAALAIFGCDEPTPPPRPQVRAPPVKPLPRVSHVEIKDAGAPVVPVVVAEAPPVDSLSLPHDTAQVDHLGRSRVLLGEGDVSGAFTEARRALFSAPSDVETLRQVAKLAVKSGQHAMAAEAYGRISTLVTDDAAPLVSRARAFLKVNDATQAVIAAREAITRDSGNTEAFQALGLAQLAEKNLAGAITSFTKAVELNPQHGYALNNLGLACLRANQNERAVEVLTRAAERLPHVAYVHNNLGVALERTGRGEEATAAYQQAMDLSPKYVKARVNAARIARAVIDTEAIEDGEEPVQ